MNIRCKLASPLFILRKQCETDLFSVLEKIKEIGFDGVEFLGFFGKTPREIRSKLDALGLKAVGNHVSYAEFMQDIEATIHKHRELGCQYITIGGLTQTVFSDDHALSEWINNVVTIGNICRKQEITLLYHNHDFELRYAARDRSLLERILDGAPAESLSFEPDLGWIAIGGAQPEFFLDKYRTRCPIIHLKDFYAEDAAKIGNVFELDSKKGDEKHSFFEFRPIGYGIANIPALIKKSTACNPEWMVLDHDLAYERDSYADLKLSLDYVKNLLMLL